MARRQHTPEEIAAKLRLVEISCSQRRPIAIDELKYEHRAYANYNRIGNRLFMGDAAFDRNMAARVHDNLEVRLDDPPRCDISLICQFDVALKVPERVRRIVEPLEIVIKLAGSCSNTSVGESQT